MVGGTAVSGDDEREDRVREVEVRGLAGGATQDVVDDERGNATAAAPTAATLGLVPIAAARW